MRSGNPVAGVSDDKNAERAHTRKADFEDPPRPCQRRGDELVQETLNLGVLMPMYP